MTTNKMEHSDVDLSIIDAIQEDLHGIIEDLDTMSSSVQTESEVDIFKEAEEVMDLIDEYTTDPQKKATHEDTKAAVKEILEEPQNEAKSKPMHSSLTSQISHLLADFDFYNTDSFYAKCRQLQETQGITEFTKAFNEILMNRKIVRVAQHNPILANSIRTINQFVIDTMSTTFSAIALEGAQIQAKGIMDVLRKPDETFRADAKVLAIKETEKQSDAEIEAVEARDLDADVKSEQIISILKQKEQTLAAIEKNQAPLDYYIERVRSKLLKEENNRFLPAVAQKTNLLAAHIRQDLLQQDDTVPQRDALKLRTLKLEQYILVAEKLIENNQGHAAFAVFNAINHIDVTRLKATMGGLSEHAQQQFDSMGQLFDPKTMFLNYVTYAQDHNDYLLPEIIALKTEQLLLKMEGSDSSSIPRDAKGQLVDSFKTIRASSEHIELLKVPVDADSTLIKSIDQLSTQGQDQEKQLEIISKQLEPRNTYIKPKSMHLYETLMEPVDLDKRLHNLIKYSDKKSMSKLINECHNMMSSYGFAKFEEAFDRILITDELSKSHQRQALKTISQQIVDSKFQTFVGLITEAGKTYASNLMDTLKRPDEFFRERAEQAVEKYSTKLEQLEVTAQEKIGQVQASALDEAKKTAEIEKINHELAKDKRENSEKAQLPYQIEEARRKSLTSFSSDLIKCCQMVNNYVANDITSKTSIDERTIALERYLLLTEKMITSGNVDTAFQIYGALTRESVRNFV